MKIRLFAFVIAVIVIASLLAACGEKDLDNTDTSIVFETTVVIETTADGGTVERDSDGNIITKNTEGEVVFVEDKNGNSVDVNKYVASHSWILNNDSDNIGNRGITGGQSVGTSNSNSGESYGNKSDDNSSEIDDEQVEETIPVVVATIPDNDDSIAISGF